MSCHLHVEDFNLGGLHDPSTGICRTPNCQWRFVGMHPNRTSTIIASPAPGGGSPGAKAADVGELQTADKFCSRLEVDDGDIPEEGTGLLRLQRDLLVDQIISAAESKKKHVLLRGAAGTGKTSLLARVARKLEALTKRVLVAANPSMLPKLEALLELGRQSDQSDLKIMASSTSPLYLLIDEAQQSYGRGVLQALLKVPAKNRNIIIIAAGIPGKDGESAAFTSRIESDRVLLSEEEVIQEEVIQFFGNKLTTALRTIRPAVPESATRDATTVVLKFSHHYTAGHAYACLKVAEYCVRNEAERCVGQQPWESLGLALGSESFLSAAGRDIFKRCFPFFCDYNSVEDLRNKYSSGSTALVSKLQEHGLWDKAHNCLLSPLLQYHLFHLMPKNSDFSFDNPSQIGLALFHCTKDYKKWRFNQYDACSEVVRERCEDGAGFFVGCELSKYCLVSPQHAVPKAQPTPGRPPSVDYYLNGRLNMYLELVKNSSLLASHFDRFLTGDYGMKKPFAILDINFKTTAPRQLTGKYKTLENNYFTFVVQTRVLYRGMKPFVPDYGSGAEAASASTSQPANKAYEELPKNKKRKSEATTTTTKRIQTEESATVGLSNLQDAKPKKKKSKK
eukprot:gene5778-6365_t